MLIFNNIPVDKAKVRIARRYKLPQLAWYETSELKLPLPDDWRIEVCNMAGYDHPAMSDDQTRHSITNFIDSPLLRRIIQG